MPAIEVIHLQEAELDKKIRGPKQDGVEHWKVQGTFEEAEAYTALALQVPETIDGADGETLYLDRISCKNDQADLWDGTAYYISEEAKGEQEEKEKQKNPPDDVEWDFDTTGGTHHITSSFETRIFGDGDDNRIYNSYSNAINVKRTKTGFDVKGVDVVVPQLEFSGTIPYAPGAITLDWIRNVARATGKTNSQPWKGFEAGELLFKGARITAKRYNKTVVRFNFSASENITAADNFKIGDIGPIIKPGHAHLWVEYHNIDEVTREGRIAIFPRAQYAYVEKLYRDFDFNQLPIQ